MSLTSQGKKVVGRSRCDSPPPVRDSAASRCVDASPSAEKQSNAMWKDAQTSAPPVSSLAALLAIALLVGHAALQTDSEELLGNTPTCWALVIFLMVGAVVMRFDFMDAVKEEATKEGLQFLDQLSLIPAGCCWLFLGCGVALLLALAGAQDGLVDPLFMEELHMHATNLKDALFGEELLGNTPTWTALVIFLMVGAVVMRFDFIEAVKEEAKKQGLQSTEQIYVITTGRRRLILGCGVALAFAVTRRWDDIAIFFLSAVLVIGLATTISNSFALK